MSVHPGDVAVPVPFTSKLGSEISAGQTLNIHGVVNSDASRAAVNLLCDTPVISPNVGQVALHVNLRFDEGKVVLNSMTGGEWGKEKRVGLPFKKGEKFDLKIRVHEDKYEILANQKEIAEFEIRVPLSNINHMQVEGDISLNGVHWGGRYYKLPFETRFEGGHLRDGQRVYIYGIPKGDRFNIDFVAQNGDVLFHFNPRLKEKQVVRNSQIAGQWGGEEREGPFPFKKEIAFDLVFFNESYSIQIFVDGERIGTFAHRTGNPASDYIGLRIDGEVDLTGIEFGHH
uniref:Galectin n=3 Tax=Steinernema glaseri TaxID=37863 RepID=A0A1I7YCJ9_9BILA